MQHGDARLAWMNRLLRSLSTTYRRDRSRNGQSKPAIVRLQLDIQEELSSNGGARSSEVVQVMSQWFDTEIILIGMTLALAMTVPGRQRRDL